MVSSTDGRRKVMWCGKHVTMFAEYPAKWKFICFPRFNLSAWCEWEEMLETFYGSLSDWLLAFMRHLVIFSGISSNCRLNYLRVPGNCSSYCLRASNRFSFDVTLRWRLTIDWSVLNLKFWITMHFLPNFTSDESLEADRLGWLSAVNYWRYSCGTRISKFNQSYPTSLPHIVRHHQKMLRLRLFHISHAKIFLFLNSLNK